MKTLEVSGNDTAGEGRETLSVAIVLYRPAPDVLEATLSSLGCAARRMNVGASAILTLIDHSPDAGVSRAQWISELGARFFPGSVDVVLDPANPGFGGGHNRALPEVRDYHLVLNPDVELAPDALRQAIDFMQRHPDCGLLSPAAFFADGTRQYLCKRYPTVLDLLLRGFAPQAVRRFFSARLDRYEMRNQIGDAVIWDPPIVSGCFMLFRGDVFRQLGGFDPRFFLYFEDFDLSLRAGRITRLAYVPTVRIVHHGGHAARKGLRHVWMFGRSAITFFSKHGWRWF